MGASAGFWQRGFRKTRGDRAVAEQGLELISHRLPSRTREQPEMIASNVVGGDGGLEQGLPGGGGVGQVYLNGRQGKGIIGRCEAQGAAKQGDPSTTSKGFRVIGTEEAIVPSGQPQIFIQESPQLLWAQGRTGRQVIGHQAGVVRWGDGLEIVETQGARTTPAVNQQVGDQQGSEGRIDDRGVLLDRSQVFGVGRIGIQQDQIGNRLAPLLQQATHFHGHRSTE